MFPSYFDSERLPWLLRGGLFLAGLTLMGLLITAACLEPDPRGFGTHQQLGLLPCTFQVLFEIPCPSCGMTTSWSRLLHGQVLGSLRANPGGTLLALLAFVAGPWWLATSVRGRWVGRPPTALAIAACSGTVLVVSLVHWALKLLGVE